MTTLQSIDYHAFKSSGLGLFNSYPSLDVW